MNFIENLPGANSKALVVFADKDSGAENGGPENF
jgi:hypothetical protein